MKKKRGGGARGMMKKKKKKMQQQQNNKNNNNKQPTIKVHRRLEGLIMYSIKHGDHLFPPTDRQTFGKCIPNDIHDGFGKRIPNDIYDGRSVVFRIRVTMEPPCTRYNIVC